MRVLTLLLLTVLAIATPTPAVAAPDPYLDAIAPWSEVPVVNGEDLLGAPDGQFATVSGRRFAFLVLDLGAGEEGVGDLEVRYTNPPGAIWQSMDVHFVAEDGRDLGQGQLALLGTGPRTTTVDNPSTRPYRYLRILTGLQTVDIDAMTAAALA